MNATQYTATDMVTMIAALSAAIVAVINAYHGKNDRVVIRDTNEQVSTLNGQSIGQLSDAAESRRIAAKPEEKRTPAEEEHIGIVGIVPELKGPA